MKIFSNIPKNQIIFDDDNIRSLPIPSKKDLEAFKEFFSKKYCKKIECTINIDILAAIDCFKNFISLSAKAREYYRIINIGRAQLSDPEDFMCLSFDWGQNWEIPRYAKQPGELYFLSRQRVGIFGITDEKSDVQTFYCLPEKELLSYGKGPNSTLSYVYHYLTQLQTLPKK